MLVDELEAWMEGKEDEHLEFKEARNRFDFEELVRYCAALANEGGGKLILGVTDRRPRRVVGTRAFEDLERTKAGLVESLRLRLNVDELDREGRRVLVFHVPPRPIGVPVAFRGAYWMRAGESLVPMTPDQLRRIFEEAGPDFSAELCPGATLDDLAASGLEAFRRRWHRKSGIDDLLEVGIEQLLSDAELLIDGQLTYAALVLLGSRQALTRHLAQAEVIFEYRSSDAAGPANHREDMREGVLLTYDRIWELVNLRNDSQHFQDGLFVLDVPTFDERTVREALLNAVSHRDYRDAGSVFVRQYPRRLEIVSPGGFPVGITQENLLWQQKPRNRRIAEALARCGLVERAGQGFDLIYGECIRHGKDLPDFSRTDLHFVWMTLDGTIQDPAFLRFLEQVGRETTASLRIGDLLVLDHVHRDVKVPAHLHAGLRRLVELGLVERVGRGRGTWHLLSRRLYKVLGRTGAYTRLRGLDRETNKALLVRHLTEAKPDGASISVLQQVLPGLSRDQVRTLLDDLRAEGRIELHGYKRAAQWHVLSNPKTSA